MAAVPGPSIGYILRHARELAADPLRGFAFLASFGDIAVVRFGGQRTYFINHPDLVRQVLVTKAGQFQKAVLLKRVFDDSVGNNVFTGDGEFWKRQRQLMQPAFHTQRIGAYAEIMVDHAGQLVNQWHDGQTISAAAEMMHLTMGIVTKTLFGTDLSDDSAGAAFSNLFEIVNRRIGGAGRLNLPHWLPTRDNRTMRASVKTIDAVPLPMIEQRRRSGQDTGDLLSMLLISGMDDAQLRNEAMTLFGAGYETTANTLTWILYILTQYPEVESRVRAEIDLVLPGKRPATLADLDRLTYTEKVVKETMRFYPTSVAISRDAVEDVEIGDTIIPKGASVLFSQWLLHRDARFWDAPEQFDPERFNPENEATINKYAYLPFGGGPRVCVGNAFALMEARLALVTILQHARLTLAPAYVMQPQFRFTLRPSGGLPMVVHMG